MTLAQAIADARASAQLAARQARHPWLAPRCRRGWVDLRDREIARLGELEAKAARRG